MIKFREFLLYSMIASLCRAVIVFKSPAVGEVVGPGAYKIRASDSGIVPTLGQFDDGSWEIVLFTGNDTSPYELWTYKLSGYKMTNPTTQSPGVNIRNYSAPNLENKYFFGYRSYLTSNESIWVTAYSDRFTFTNMTGTLPDDVVAANNNVNSTTAPERTISCGAKSGGACDKKVLENLGLGAATGDSSSGTSTTASATGNASSAGGQANANTNSSKELSSGTIAGIVVGVLVGIAIIAATAMFLVMRAKKRNASRGEKITNDTSLIGQKPSAFHEGNTYGGMMKENRAENTGGQVELEGDRAYEMSAERHRIVEMPGSS